MLVEFHYSYTENFVLALRARSIIICCIKWWSYAEYWYVSAESI